MRSEIRDLVHDAMTGDTNNLSMYMMYGKSWLNIRQQLRLRKVQFPNHPPLYELLMTGNYEAVLENWTFAVRKGFLDARLVTYAVELEPGSDQDPGVNDELKKAGLKPIFVFDRFRERRSPVLDDDPDDHTYESYNERWHRTKEKTLDDSYYLSDSRGYAPGRQPRTTHVAFLTETDAIAARALLDIYYDDDFAKAS